MGILAQTLQSLVPQNQGPSLMSVSGTALGGGAAGPAASYQSAVRNGYQRNEIIFSAIELLCTSAAEPIIAGRKYKSAENRKAAKQRANWLQATGMPLWAISETLNRQGLQEDLDERQHPLVKILNNPNPLNSRFQFYSTFIMDRYLAGNAYALKARGPLGNLMELWRLRPDRVRVKTDSKGQLTGYTYTVDRDNSVTFKAEDVVHWKTRNPLDDHYGQPPLMALTRRLDIDNFMTDFVGMFFRQGGQPGAILTTKTKLSQEAKDSIRDRLRARFSNPGGWFETMILDANESTYTPMTQALGQRGLVMPELNAITEARIAMLFGIPPSILGLLVGLESSSYANKRQDWQVLWDITLAPLYSDLDDQLNLSITPEFSGIDEVVFDLSTVKALQEDVDKLQERARKNLQVGGWTLEEFRICTGMDPESDGLFLMPLGSTTETALMRTLRERVEPLGSLIRSGFDPQSALRALGLPAIEHTGELPVTTRDDNPPAPQLPPPANLALSQAAEIVEEFHCPSCGRWVGRNLNVGATVYCQKCKEIEVVA